MRGFAFVLALLVALPAVSALAVPSPHAAAPVVAPLPADLSDGDLVRLLAAHAGYHPVVPKFILPRDATLVSLVTKLGARAGASVSPPDVAPFATLDARVQAPALALLAVIDQAWDLRDQAFAKLTLDEQRELLQLQEARVAAHDAPRISPRETQLDAMVDKKPLFAAAILLLDTIDSTVTPLTQSAVAAGAWPATATADPIGILRIGGTGNDVESVDRIAQLDPRGNDTYYNRAGGTTLLRDLNPLTLDSAIAVSLDYGGNDNYRYLSGTASQGYGGLGVGLLQDYEGNDRYACWTRCQGSDITGLGMLHDYSGNDNYTSDDRAAGFGTVLSFLRDDRGNDGYYVDTWSGGVSDADEATGLLWDRAGTDSYALQFRFHGNYGWSYHGGRGWLVDEGAAIDYYAPTPTDAHACNDCTWIAGDPGDHSAANGRGNDNRGGLAALLNEDGALFRS